MIVKNPISRARASFWFYFFFFPKYISIEMCYCAQMPKKKDKPCPNTGIASREHFVRPAGGLKGQRSYPFKSMVKNDYFRVYSPAEACKVRSALLTFYRSPSYAGRYFTVRPSDTLEGWICRRTA